MCWDCKYYREDLGGRCTNPESERFLADSPYGRGLVCGWWDCDKFTDVNGWPDGKED